MCIMPINCFDTIVDVRERLALCVLCVCVTHVIGRPLDYVGGFHIRGAHLEVCVGWYPSQELSWGLPLAEGEGLKLCKIEGSMFTCMLLIWVKLQQVKCLLPFMSL